MGLIYEAKKQGLWPPETERRSKSPHSRLGGLVIESAESVRFAYATLPLPKGALPEMVPLEQETELTAPPEE